MDGRSSEHTSRSRTGRSLTATGARLLSIRASPSGLYRGGSAYPHSILRVFREKVKKKAGPGRACLEVWPDLGIATVIKHTQKKRVVESTRQITWGAIEKAQQLLQMTRGCKEFNTSLIERFNGTMRERLASLTRKCRHAARRLETLETGMYLIGTTYNFCGPHHELSNRKHWGDLGTPAMVAGLTDPIWRVSELLSVKGAPALWVEPKRGGRARKATGPDPTGPKRPRGRPRKVA